MKETQTFDSPPQGYTWEWMEKNHIIREHYSHRVYCNHLYVELLILIGLIHRFQNDSTHTQYMKISYNPIETILKLIQCVRMNANNT